MKALGKHKASVFFKLIYAQVKPLALYASEVWGVFPHETVEKDPAVCLEEATGCHIKDTQLPCLWRNGEVPILHRRKGKGHELLAENYKHGHIQTAHDSI